MDNANRAVSGTISKVGGDFFRTVLDDLPNFVYVCSEDHRIEYMNRKTVERTGFDATGQFCYKILHGRDSVCPWCVNDRVFAGETIRWQVQSEKDGLWYDSLNCPCLLADGRTVKLAIFDPIPPSAPLIENHQVFKTLVDSASDAIFFGHPETGRILYANQTASENLGYSQEELLGMTVGDYADNVMGLQDWHDLVARARREGSVRFETEQRRKDGTKLPVEVNIKLARAGQQECMVSNVRDITERKRAEAALIEEKNKVEAVMEAMDDGITVQNSDFRVVFQNENHIRRQGRHLGELCYQAYQGRDEICEGCLVEKSFADGRIHRRETRAETERGPLFLEVASCPLKDADGKVTACVEVARDVTEKRLAEEKLAQLKEEVLSGISHEMSTPLTAMIGFAEFMLDNELEREEQREYLAILLKESFRLGDLIDNILALQRFRAGFSLEQLASVSLAPLLEEVAELFRRSASRHQIVLECPADLPPVQGDESRLQQVVKNLLSNAVKYSPEGGTVTLGARGEGETVILSVTDRGLGIPADEQENVFERFFRGRVRAKISGTGLGLALVKEVVEAHGGAVRVESAEGQGSTFSLRLPLDGPAGSSRGKLPA